MAGFLAVSLARSLSGSPEELADDLGEQDRVVLLDVVAGQDGANLRTSNAAAQLAGVVLGPSACRPSISNT